VRIGTTAIGPIFQRAVASNPPACALKYADEPKLVLLVSLCRELQRDHGTKPFFLSCNKAGELLGGTHPQIVWRWLQLLLAHGVVKLATKGKRGRNMLASEFYYAGD
jgi:hypothetical protein